ncbi:hypothetical protein EYF80_065305 [Liparis tanakae]|uniref:Uncharacterized protein n=1 Tax=Liparis tanakae TaxID=230148 RepID=A0A4Z2E726_9TELE|nr:hypothetical protein EYF80_065305 [Liparis tanakae]
MHSWRSAFSQSLAQRRQPAAAAHATGGGRQSRAPEGPQGRPEAQDETSASSRASSDRTDQRNHREEKRSGGRHLEGESLQDGPEHDAQGEDVGPRRVAPPTPHLRRHVEVGAAGGGVVLPAQLAVHRALAHPAQAEVRHLEAGGRIDSESKGWNAKALKS